MILRFQPTLRMPWCPVLTRGVFRLGMDSSPCLLSGSLSSNHLQPILWQKPWEIRSSTSLLILACCEAEWGQSAGRSGGYCNPSLWLLYPSAGVTRSAQARVGQPSSRLESHLRGLACPVERSGGLVRNNPTRSLTGP